jgi:type II secretory pathway pseudopilin PulG
MIIGPTVAYPVAAMARSTHGFTQIELLVVVKIIVLLLALLAPALDRAIYQAELATCSAGMDGLANAAILYTSSSKQYYPTRSGVQYNYFDQPCTLKGPYDDRPTLRPYIPINKIQCPLTDGANLETTQSSAVWSSYRLWFGWRFVNHSGMIKRGNRWSWSTVEDGSIRFRVLLSDADTVADTAGLIYTSHPDNDGALNLVPYQDQPSYGTALPGGVGGAFTMWTYRGTTYRGALDMNFAYDDGSVDRLTDIKMNEVSFNGQKDSERVTWVPEDTDASRSVSQPGDQYRTTLPLTNR